MIEKKMSRSEQKRQAILAAAKKAFKENNDDAEIQEKRRPSYFTLWINHGIQMGIYSSAYLHMRRKPG